MGYYVEVEGSITVKPGCEVQAMAIAKMKDLDYFPSWRSRSEEFPATIEIVDAHCSGAEEAVCKLAPYLEDQRILVKGEDGGYWFWIIEDGEAYECPATDPRPVLDRKAPLKKIAA